MRINFGKVLLGVLFFVFTLTASGAAADDFELVGAGQVRAQLSDGTEIRGELMSQDSAEVVIRTSSGAEIRIPRTAIVWLREGGQFNPGSRFDAFDPNYTRLTIMPTARPLRRGAGFVSDTWIFFPSVSYGVLDNFMMTVGGSLFPFIDLNDQLLFLSPKVGFTLTDRLALSVGALYVRIPDDIDNLAVGVVYGVATYGGKDSHLSLGMGWGYYKEEDEDFEFGKTPATLLGGYLRTTEISALMFETWYYPYDEYEIKYQPFGFGVRLFGERIAVDAALFTTLEGLSEGHIGPWLAASYNFGALK